MEDNKFEYKEEHKEEHAHSHKSKKRPTNVIKKNPWILSTIVLFILVVILLITSYNSGISGKAVGENFVKFINSKGGAQIEYLQTNDFSSNLYEVIVDSNGNQVPVYITKDGNYFVQIISEIDDGETQEVPQENTQEIVQSDVPLVQLFVMTHCPYGTQAEKGFLPAIEYLGDTIDAEVRFVHYFLHDPEYTETPIQVCIREEQSERYWDYLSCFLEDGDSERCQDEVGVDLDSVTECVDSGKWEDYYGFDSDLSEAAGVRGSPTLVINGQIVQSGRSSAAYLDTICQAFTDESVPELCGGTLDDTNPAPGFGWDGGSSGGTTAQC